VNSPLKPPPQNSNKDSTTPGLGGNSRKTSISHGQGPSAFGLSSPVSSRPTARRQQTSDSIGGMPSPAGTGRFSRDESSPFFTRKFNESKDMSEDREEAKSNLPFGGLMRSNTGGAAFANGPASPWGPPSATAAMTPMGNFGSFALGGPSANPPTPGEKRPAFGRGESRLAHLMPKESAEDLTSKVAERSWRPSGRQRTDTDPFGDDSPAGSAVLGGGQDDSPPSHRAGGIDTPVRGASSDFGMSELQGFRDVQRAQSHQTPQTHQNRRDDNEPSSPSETNPYRSPPEDRHEDTEGGFEMGQQQPSRLHGLGGIPEHGFNSFGGLPRGFANAAFDGSDRSQTSSVTGSKGFPSLGGLGNLSNLGGMGGWPTSANPVGTPDREVRPNFNNAFGSSLFGPMGELQSPGLGMFGSGTTGNMSGSNTAGRGSKLGSLFPAAMQAQMQTADNEPAGDGSDGRQQGVFGAIGRNAFPPSRDTDSPMRTGRHPFDELFPSDAARNQGVFSSSEMAPGQSVTAFGQTSSAQSGYQQSQGSSDSASNLSNQLPTSQQRTMVMPDRMRWVYLDPQGQTQGPWSGLEMHDWYKASFFTADLSVKKLEDADFEPLGQLIRRIGNSREPFLVPQIGIQHGKASAPSGAAFTPATNTPGNNTVQPGSVQPPFAGAFPSFGTTLTAEQQNNLERRKQEEQYLMARQREFLAQQQVNMKQMQLGGIPSSLHHHSSAHSLQSQPSFGSISSPIGMPPQPPLPSGVSGFFDGRQAPGQGGRAGDQTYIEEEMARMEMERQKHFQMATPGGQPHASQIAAIFGTQLPIPHNEQNDPQGFKARLRQFEQLREEHELEESRVAGNTTNDPIGPPQSSASEMRHAPESIQEEEQYVSEPPQSQTLSMTQQVQKAVSAKHSPISTQPESPWGKVNTSLPMPFPPPPQSTTPLPAPTAQRGRSNLPDTLNAETRSRSETPDTASAASSLAPWAKETTDAPKHPSLREIQEIEAKKAAKAEEAAAAHRRQLLEQEIKLLSAQPVAPAPGLPTTSTWGNTASPISSTNVPSAWAKPSAASKIHITSSSASSKKTLADIQREEENRKNKLAAAALAAQPAPAVSGGKRYADLASKASAALPPMGSAWSTVGAGGKVRIPTGPSSLVPPPAVRAVSSANLAAVSPRVARPVVAPHSVTSSASASASSANEEFTKWAKGSLAKGLNSDINGTPSCVFNFLSTC
jgi:PERQ amino acid-rich with GYF domain-containing protein